MNELESAGQILVCLRWGIGDMVMEIPALNALRHHAPGVKITIIGADPAIQLLEEDAGVNFRLSYQQFGFTHWGDEGTASTRGKFANWLRRKKFDVVFDPSHAPTAVGCLIRENDGMIYDAPHEQPDPVLLCGGNCTEAVNTAMSCGWGIELPRHSTSRIHFSPEAGQWAGSFIRRFFPGREPVIGISRAASSPLKTWPAEHFDDLCDRLDRKGYNLLVLSGTLPSAPLKTSIRGGPVCPPDLREVGYKSGRTALLGRIHLMYTATLLARCRLLICNDTGLMHMAAAVDTPVVGIFGPTAPSIYLPRKPFSLAVSPSQISCSHRIKYFIGPPRCVIQGQCRVREKPCISEITVDEVLSKAEELFDYTNKKAEMKRYILPMLPV